MIEAILWTTVGAIVAASGRHTLAWMRFRRWRMMPRRAFRLRLRDRIRWVRTLRSLERMLRRTARDQLSVRTPR